MLWFTNLNGIKRGLTKQFFPAAAFSPQLIDISWDKAMFMRPPVSPFIVLVPCYNKESFWYFWLETRFAGIYVSQSAAVIECKLFVCCGAFLHNANQQVVKPAIAQIYFQLGDRITISNAENISGITEELLSHKFLLYT